MRFFSSFSGAFLSNLADLSTPGAKRLRYGQMPNPFIGQWEDERNTRQRDTAQQVGPLSGKRLPRLVFPGLAPHRDLSNQRLGFSKSHSIKILLTMST
jgi:hypothetical protein